MVMRFWANDNVVSAEVMCSFLWLIGGLLILSVGIVGLTL